ncbi:hypothetical protein [Candidatus Mesenet endosymbiont of Phosphuga atrata]|uniref:hypothetical protein n=1 Tax=Candidatus Mesenet endosymbiont of Phosphuga atrata TaxID=3066221 RepID=UPI0030CF7A91
MPGTGPTPSPRSSLDQNIDEQAAQKNLAAKQENQYATINKKRETDERKRSSESSGSAEDEKKKHRRTKHAEGHHSRSSSSTDREHKGSPHSTKEKRHKSKSHGEKHHSRPSSLAEKEPIYAEIGEQHTPQLIDSPDGDTVFSRDDMLKAINIPGDEGVRKRNVNPLKKPLRAHLQNSDGASTSSSKDSSPPSYTSNGNAPWGNASRTLKEMLASVNPPKTIANSWSKFKTKVAYPVQQRAFIIPSVAFITFMASYSILMPKYYASIQNLTKDPLLSIPIIIASVLFAASMMAFISNLQDTRIKITRTKDDNQVFKEIKNINNEKCIRSIELDLSNNTHYTLLDGRKYKTLAFKKLALTLNRPLICAEMAAFVTLASTYLLTKYFQIGFKNLADSISTFNTNNMELIGFTAAAGVILTLFMCSFVHYYRKECVEGLELKKCPREIASLNKEFIGEAERCYNSKKTLSSGKHSEGKAASLTIDQAIVEYYNSKAVIVAS